MKKLFFTNAKYNKLGKAFSKRPTTYKKLAKQIIIAILFTVVTVTSCKENLVNDNSGKTQTQLQEETYPKDIPFEEYLLEGTSCEWTGFEPNTVIIINNNEDLENHINCTADSSPEIDFSKNSLLLVLVTDVAGCNIDSHVEKLLLKQLSANNYELSIEINPSLTANVAPFFKYIAVITEKLDGKSAIELNVIKTPIKSISIWECIIEQYGATITLTIDSATNLVSVSKSPEEFGDQRDGYLFQFVHGDQYLLKNDTLYYLVDSERGNKDTGVFAITRISEDEIELEYLGAIWAEPHYMSKFLFNKKIE